MLNLCLSTDKTFSVKKIIPVWQTFSKIKGPEPLFFLPHLILVQLVHSSLVQLLIFRHTFSLFHLRKFLLDKITPYHKRNA